LYEFRPLRTIFKEQEILNGSPGQAWRGGLPSMKCMFRAWTSSRTVVGLRTCFRERN